eukprot:scpid90482/ scgid10679/ 
MVYQIAESEEPKWVKERDCTMHCRPGIITSLTFQKQPMHVLAQCFSAPRHGGTNVCMACVTIAIQRLDSYVADSLSNSYVTTLVLSTSAAAAYSTELCRDLCSARPHASTEQAPTANCHRVRTRPMALVQLASSGYPVGIGAATVKCSAS